MSKKVLIVFLISIAFKEIASWTIDLPEARKYFFEKAEKDKQKNKENVKDFNRQDLFFDNIVADSPHNMEEMENTEENSNDSDNDVYGGRYAEDYEYMSYMEKKVHGIVHNGSVYLEGLRRALEGYGELLHTCTRLNFTQPLASNGPWLPQNERPLPTDPQNTSNSQNTFTLGQSAFNSQQDDFNQQQNAFNQQQSAFNQQQTAFNQQQNQQTASNQSFDQGLDRETCERATQASEHVKRLAQLALWATRELQDRAYADKYDKEYPPSDEEEEAEAELLLRLAFFLDRLAALTGFEPEPKDYFTTPAASSSTTAPTTPLSVMGDVPDEVKTMMMSCLQSNSSLAATERCRYPLQYPEFLRTMLNITEPSASVRPLNPESTSPRGFNNLMIPNGRQKRGIVAVENRDTLTDELSKPTILTSEYRDILTAVRQTRDVITDDRHKAESVDIPRVDREKRSIDLGDIARSIGNTLLPISAIFGDTLKPMAQELDSILQKNLQGNFFQKNVGGDVKRDAETLTADSQYQDILTEGGSLKSDGLTGVAQDATIDSEVNKIVSSVTRQKRRHKRSIDGHPLKNIINYYVKHKMWTNSNTEVENADFDVANHLTAVKTEPPVKVKRSIDSKKSKHLLVRLPEDPFQDISGYLKHRSGLNYVKNENESAKMRQYLDKIRHGDSVTAKSFMKKLSKLSRRQKRSIKYQNKFLPSPSQDPRQDISYFQKYKVGTDYQNNVVQAAQVRAALERDFNTGNILVVQRYGSNYNPLVQNPLALGLMQSFFTDL